MVRSFKIQNEIKKDSVDKPKKPRRKRLTTLKSNPYYQDLSESDMTRAIKLSVMSAKKEKLQRKKNEKTEIKNDKNKRQKLLTSDIETMSNTLNSSKILSANENVNLSTNNDKTITNNSFSLGGLTSPPVEPVVEILSGKSDNGNIQKTIKKYGIFYFVMQKILIFCRIINT